LSRGLILIAIAFSNALRGIRNASTTSSLAVLTIAIVLVLVGSATLLVENMSGLLDEFGAELQLTAYLETSISEEDQRLLAGRVAGAPGVERVDVVTKEEALERFEAIAGGAELLAGLDGNPHPESLEIHLRPEARTAEAIGKL
jgi:cell division transport system permease protein